MKRYILCWAFLTGLLLSAPVSLQAQSDARTRSRLEMGRAAPNTIATNRSTGSSFSTARKLPFLSAPASTGLDRTVSLNKTSAINAYYRSLLLAPAPSAPVVKVASRTVQPETTAVTTPAETRPAVEESLRTERMQEDRLFANDRIVVSNVYPNPASEYAEIDYQITAPVGEARIIVSDILGSPIAEYTLEANDRKVRITTRDFATGMYFYRLSLDGKKVATKKLLVQHR
ncbi:MAG: T9SS C-terminal target domain-containing protein [Cytophagales bacterium]|nr:MAG: T9SS C-terminal target domain-containing protein [Cytophagales bacterium]